jgi:hypothetical protein
MTQGIIGSYNSKVAKKLQSYCEVSQKTSSWSQIVNGWQSAGEMRNASSGIFTQVFSGKASTKMCGWPKPGSIFNSLA